MSPPPKVSLHRDRLVLQRGSHNLLAFFRITKYFSHSSVIHTRRNPLRPSRGCLRRRDLFSKPGKTNSAEIDGVQLPTCTVFERQAPVARTRPAPSREAHDCRETTVTAAASLAAEGRQQRLLRHARAFAAAAGLSNVRECPDGTCDGSGAAAPQEVIQQGGWGSERPPLEVVEVVAADVGDRHLLRAHEWAQ